MSPQVSASNMKAPHVSNTKHRPIASFHPSIWKDHFLAPIYEALEVEDEVKEEREQLKEEVRKMLIVVVENPFDKLKLVDWIQKLGVFYHFEKEINQVLEHMYVTYKNFLNDFGDEDLNTVSLLFRMLRQQGYRISCDIFSKFMKNDGQFKESLRGDTRGILSLYEAAHLRIHGEDILEKALDFTTNHLKKLVADSTSPFTTEIKNALKWPIRKALPRVKARDYMVIYQQDPSHNDALLTFSKLDFNILQKLHQSELNAITRWWKDLDLPRTLPFARDRIVECYFWILGVYFEPHFSIARKILTKVTAMTSILDDMYDAYGTYEELEILTLAIKRWDISMVNLLPEYMKVYYKTLLELYEEIGRDIGKDGKSYQIHFAKEAMKRLAESYFKEAEWLSKRYRPNFDEYMEVALDSSGYAVLATISFVGMGDIATREVFDWLSKHPKIIEASTMISRLMDDVMSYKFEQQREHVVSAVECYMEQYGCSEEEACVEFNKQVAEAWKDINEACLHPTTVPMIFLMRVLNLSRVMALLYVDEDGYTNSKGRTKFLIESLLVDPVSL
ncbi:(+)-gamma-cadinene synthase-like [Momordica charantia]|uniref:(+)-gamma-cadinene synthase-like n=1 Tax=Momordica charantia TaxID=3673 RepID=A0A6J1CNP6_MOMCH|nr:(+)-gamma-cadinene synthase-like [Momordica charantia]